MFGIGMPEMILILAVALIVIGPKKLPDLAKSLGRAMGEFKKATSDLKQSMETDTGLSEVKETLDDINSDIKQSISFDNIEDYKPADRVHRPVPLSRQQIPVNSKKEKALPKPWTT